MKPKETSEHYILSSSPHAHSKTSVHSIMRDVIIALMPASACAVWFFGIRAVWLMATCIAATVVTEAVCRLAMKRDNSIGDLSAVLTGLLLALNLPPDLPLWMAAVGSVFAIAIAKQAFGGLGYNPFNPALAARAFMLISFTGAMTTWSFPNGWNASASTGATSVDAMTCATPLALIKKGDVAQLSAFSDLLFGNIGGCIGETCAIALLAGAAYLLIRRVITWHIPVSFLATMFLFALCKGGVPPIFHVLSGGAILGACFMATDYVTSPITAKGKIAFGIGCGLLTMCIRSGGGYPEGVSFAILIMNAITPLINRFTQPKPFGVDRRIGT